MDEVRDAFYERPDIQCLPTAEQAAAWETAQERVEAFLLDFIVEHDVQLIEDDNVL